MAHETVNFRRKNYGLQILSCFESYTFLLTKVHNNSIDVLYKIQNKFIWLEKKTKTEHSTLYYGYEKRGIKVLT